MTMTWTGASDLAITASVVVGMASKLMLPRMTSVHSADKPRAAPRVALWRLVRVALRAVLRTVLRTMLRTVLRTLARLSQFAPGTAAKLLI